MDVNLIIKNNIKKAVPEMNVASEVASALNDLVNEILKKAEQRARANQRRTIQARDL